MKYFLNKPNPGDGPTYYWRRLKLTVEIVVDIGLLGR